MTLFFADLTLPFTEPVIIIALILVILLIGPVFFERIHIPSIVGLLLSGTLIGPNGFNLVPADLEFSLLGTFGLLYLMFLAGLEIDLIDFIETKSKSIFIGLASFGIPFVLGFFVFSYFFSLSAPASLLIASALSSHTLISYPLLGRLGIVNKPIVTIVVGATIIADILALLAMEMITKTTRPDFQIQQFFTIGIEFFVFFFFELAVIPRISRVFINKYESEMGVQYIFVMAVLFVSALTALLLHIEPIIGAFFSGLVLNRQIPNNSPLYKRINFIGNTLFIPFFLISIGMLVNFRVYLVHPTEIGFAFVLFLTAIAGKFLAAQGSKWVLKISEHEKNLVFGLSVSRAASAVAIILVGYNMNIVDETVLNGTVILILLSCVTSTYVTQYAGKKILMKENESLIRTARLKQKFLVPLANPANMENLLNFALLIKETNDDNPVYPLTIFTDRDKVAEKINENQEIIKKVIESLNSEVIFEHSIRIDTNVTDGIARAAEEVVATGIVLGWHKNTISFHLLFGTVLDHVLEKTHRMVLVLKTPVSFNEIKKITLFCPENAHFENGFTLWIKTLYTMASNLSLKVQVNCDSVKTIDAFKHYIKKQGASKYFVFHQGSSKSLKNAHRNHNSSELMIFVHSRKKAVSYSRSFEHFMNNSINLFSNNNVVIIYPEQ